MLILIQIKILLHTKKKKQNDDICPICQENLRLTDKVSNRFGLVDEEDNVVGWMCAFCRSEFDAEDKIVTINDDEFGSMEYKAPCHIIAKPGVKRVLHALEDSVWYNTHMNPTGTIEVEEVERNTVAVDYKKYDEYIKNK